MIIRVFYTKLIQISLGFAILIGLLPMSNYALSMHMRRMSANTSSITAISLQNNTGPENSRTGASGSCCDDALGPQSLTCAFVVPQSDYVALSRGSQRAAYLAPIVQTIYLEAATLPPKI